MIIGHAPAGYVLSTLLIRRFSLSTKVPCHILLTAGTLGALVPDLDMLYFHFVDGRQHHHHSYFTHFPIVWAALLLLSACWFFPAQRKAGPIVVMIFSIWCSTASLEIYGGLHQLIMCFFSLVTVPALYKPWWLNFMLHWSFLLELGVVIWALALWRRNSFASRA